MTESSGLKGAAAGAPATAPGNPEWRRLLHQLNNIFASIHSSLDLARDQAGRPEASAFLAQAQESARRGARLINELRFGGLEAAESEPASPEPAPKATRPVDASPSTAEGTERILVAEDDECIRILIQAVLAYRGYQIVQATDGQDAVTKFQQQGPFSLVILDLRMPGLDGRGALERMRALEPAVRALALSGLPFAQEGIVADRAGGFDACLNKPFNNDELARLVRQLLDLKA